MFGMYNGMNPNEDAAQNPVVALPGMTVTAPRLPYSPPSMDPNEMAPGPSGGPPYEPQGTGEQGGGFNPASIYDSFKKYFTSGPGGGGADDPNWLERMMLLGSAFNQYNNSGKYMDMAGKYAHEMNPFDLAQRQYYQGHLKNSYEDPTKYLSDPGHLAMQEQQLNKLQSRLRAQGYMGSGKEGMDLTDYITQSDAQYLQKEREQLGQFAGAQIGPGAAADLIKTGIQGSISSQNNALANAAQALSPRMPYGGGGGGNGGGGPGVMDWLKKGATWAKSIASGGPIPWQELARLGKLSLDDPEYQAFIRAQGEAEMRVSEGNIGGPGGGSEFGPGIDPSVFTPYDPTYGYGPGYNGGGYGGEGTGIDPSWTWLTEGH